VESGRAGRGGNGALDVISGFGIRRSAREMAVLSRSFDACCSRVVAMITHRLCIALRATTREKSRTPERNRDLALHLLWLSGVRASAPFIRAILVHLFLVSSFCAPNE